MMIRRTIGIALMAAGIGAAVAPRASAQEKPCMADAARLCPDVKPGGGAQMTCLKQHKDELSPACKKKVAQAKIQHEEKMQLDQQQQQQGTTPQP